ACSTHDPARACATCAQGTTRRSSRGPHRITPRACRAGAQQPALALAAAGCLSQPRQRRIGVARAVGALLDAEGSTPALCRGALAQWSRISPASTRLLG